MVTRTLLSIACILLLSGCVRDGIIYTHKIEPYSKKFNATPVGSKQIIINTHQIKEPASGYNLYAEWTTQFIFNESRRAGINEIYYMDKQTLSVLFGIYKRESIVVYGD